MERDTLELHGLMFKASKSFNQLFHLFFRATMHVCIGMMRAPTHEGVCEVI